MRIYIAGPYNPVNAKDSHDAPRVAHQNVQRALKIGVELMKKGHNPYVPHLTHFLNIEADVIFPWELWIKNDNEWLEYCEAFYYLAPSKGADIELERAKKRGIPIFYSIEEVPEAK